VLLKPLGHLSAKKPSNVNQSLINSQASLALYRGKSHISWRLLTDSDFVDFRNYFGQFSIQIRGLISLLVYCPSNLSRKLAKRTPKSTETESVNSLLRYFMALRIFLLSCLLLAAACGKSTAPTENKKPLLLVSIAPYRFLAERIAGPDFDVQTVVPSAANPHSFEPTSRQVTGMSRCQIWFRIGEPFEGKVLPILLHRNPGLAVTDLRDGIDLIEEGHDLGCKHCSMDHLDRHIWLSPKLAQEQAALIERALSKQYPDKSAEFQNNLMQLNADLTSLDGEIRDILKGVEKRTLLVSHPAFGYFCKDYDFVQLSVEYEGKDPRPKHLEEILRRAVTESAEVALALPQYNNKGAQLIAEKLNMPVRMIDPYSADYFETMRKLAHMIAEPYAN
jgi:zinc transport system substrate-binding protein